MTVLAAFHRTATGILLGMLLAGTAAAATLTELDSNYRDLVASEQELLDQRASLQGLLETSDILIQTGAGKVVAVPRAQVERLVGKTYDWLRLFGAEQELIGLLPDDLQLMAQVALAAEAFGGTATSDAIRDKVIARVIGELQKAQAGARETVRADIALIEIALDVVRSNAADVLARRDAARDWVETGTLSPDLATTNPACDTTSVPVDARATFWKSGYGGSPFYPVKGPYICRNTNVFQLMEGGRLRYYTCKGSGPYECSPEAGPGLAYTTDTDKEGRKILRLEDGGVVTFHPPE